MTQLKDTNCMVIDAIKKGLLKVINFKTEGASISEVVLKSYGARFAKGGMVRPTTVNIRQVCAVNPKNFFLGKATIAVKNEQTYSFKGKINFRHTINDCILNNQPVFIAFASKKGYLGFTKQVENAPEFVSLMDSIPIIRHNIDAPFFVFEFGLTDQKSIIKFAKTIPALVKESIKLTKRKVRKARADEKKKNITAKNKDKKAKWKKADKVKILTYT